MFYVAPRRDQRAISSCRLEPSSEERVPQLKTFPGLWATHDAGPPIGAHSSTYPGTSAETADGVTPALVAPLIALPSAPRAHSMHIGRGRTAVSPR
jgi:hypothetical protein